MSLPAELTPGGEIRGIFSTAASSLVSNSTIQPCYFEQPSDGSAATPLLTSAVRNTAKRAVAWCHPASAIPEVYITATGGNPGLQPVPTKQRGAFLMAALAYRSSLTSSTFITINEVTTVATVFSPSHQQTPALRQERPPPIRPQWSRHLQPSWREPGRMVSLRGPPHSGRSPGSYSNLYPRRYPARSATPPEASLRTEATRSSLRIRRGVDRRNATRTPPEQRQISPDSCELDILFTLVPSNGPYQPTFLAYPPPGRLHRSNPSKFPPSPSPTSSVNREAWCRSP